MVINDDVVRIAGVLSGGGRCMLGLVRYLICAPPLFKWFKLRLVLFIIRLKSKSASNVSWSLFMLRFKFIG